MTTFAATIWAYEKTGSVTALALVQVCHITPFLIISPIAGAMIDRYNRKLMMALSDLGAGAATVGLLCCNLRAYWKCGICMWLPPSAACLARFSGRLTQPASA